MRLCFTYRTDNLVPSSPAHIDSVDIDLSVGQKNQKHSVLVVYSRLCFGTFFHSRTNNTHLQRIKTMQVNFDRWTCNCLFVCTYRKKKNSIYFDKIWFQRWGNKLKTRCVCETQMLPKMTKVTRTITLKPVERSCYKKCSCAVLKLSVQICVRP